MGSPLQKTSNHNMESNPTEMRDQYPKFYPQFPMPMSMPQRWASPTPLRVPMGIPPPYHDRASMESLGTYPSNPFSRPPPPLSRLPVNLDEDSQNSYPESLPNHPMYPMHHYSPMNLPMHHPMHFQMRPPMHPSMYLPMHPSVNPSLNPIYYPLAHSHHIQVPYLGYNSQSPLPPPAWFPNAIPQSNQTSFEEMNPLAYSAAPLSQYASDIEKKSESFLENEDKLSILSTTNPYSPQSPLQFQKITHEKNDSRQPFSEENRSNQIEIMHLDLREPAERRIHVSFTSAKDGMNVMMDYYGTFHGRLIYKSRSDEYDPVVKPFCRLPQPFHPSTAANASGVVNKSAERSLHTGPDFLENTPKCVRVGDEFQALIPHLEMHPPLSFHKKQMLLSNKVWDSRMLEESFIPFFLKNINLILLQKGIPPGTVLVANLSTPSEPSKFVLGCVTELVNKTHIRFFNSEMVLNI